MFYNTEDNTINSGIIKQKAINNAACRQITRNQPTRKAIQIKRALKLPPMSMTGSWRYTPDKQSNDSGAQIDLLFDRRDDCITLCEIKCTDKPYTISRDYLQKIEQKQKVFETVTRCKKQILWAFISCSGIKTGSHSLFINSSCTLDDLFRESG